MNEIICPHCHKAFKVDEAGYADILKQVRDTEFEQQLHDRLELAEKDKLNAVALAVAEAVSTVEKKHDALANELEKTKQERLAEARLAEAKLGALEDKQKLAITEAVSVVQKERD